MTEAEYQELLSDASSLPGLAQPGLVFTHGDNQMHKFLVDEDGYITEVLDWGMAGWLPQYFGFTVALRGLPVDF